MPRTLKVFWKIALALIVLGLAPVAIAIVGGHVSDALGMMGYLGIITLPLALVGAALVPVLAIWTLVVRLRG